ncbi:hypothetical protein KFK09_024810 [Dendrobium nobile]|uniref:Uncharacterized protein n=1 Tax=Dendrobium nobile TaxID=94219 RepID=A0A8T3AEU0_DENNO|nr:hypothetical protein KFK09_024810 [Dendrobium nobile]
MGKCGGSQLCVFHINQTIFFSKSKTKRTYHQTNSIFSSCKYTISTKCNANKEPGDQTMPATKNRHDLRKKSHHIMGNIGIYDSEATDRKKQHSS